ncbi:ABC transporter ATP-binding protein [Neomegalonema perideroedes]|uniref:ABC transporter ATP-binding protein n=1 Tax=Neomegalonema perideroedes TaxID=217219 RepID=UPI0003777891|nr:ABC transporter ATP-binding protein [Neomegalonema perideroedes]
MNLENGARPAAIELIGVSKSFGPVKANSDIHLRVDKGTIHGIVGENGAGKSTLMSILYGFYQADSGEIRINGRPVEIRDSQEAIRLGIGMVHQHFMLVENFTVLENVLLGAEGGALLGKGKAEARAKLAALAREHGLEVDPDALISDLPVGAQQRVEILKALTRGAEILILDEPTGVLTPDEADQLFEVLKQLRAEGKTVLIITHKLREIMAITDSVSVMRQGKMVGTLRTAETSPDQLAEMMVGRRVLLKVEKGPANPGLPALTVENLTLRDGAGVERLKNVSLTLRRGEIVGIAGVAGNGQSELLEAIAGLRKPSSGRILLDGAPIPHDPRALRELRLAHIPEDRHKMGLVLKFETRENSILGYHLDHRYGGALLNNSAIEAECQSQMEAYDVRPPNSRLKTANFSGGNQQKIVLAREFERGPHVLLIGQPTRGVDIGAIEFIHRRIIEMRDAGKAILLVSVELDEIRALSDRVLVMFDGRIVGERPPETDERELGLLMAGVTGAGAGPGAGTSERGAA